jgi:hypothetical protein
MSVLKTTPYFSAFLRFAQYWRMRTLAASRCAGVRFFRLFVADVAGAVSGTGMAAFFGGRPRCFNGAPRASIARFSLSRSDMRRERIWSLSMSPVCHNRPSDKSMVFGFGVVLQFALEFEKLLLHLPNLWVRRLWWLSVRQTKMIERTPLIAIQEQLRGQPFCSPSVRPFGQSPASAQTAAEVITRRSNSDVD